MKRITLLVLAFALVLGGALAASAEHVKGAGGAGLEFNAKGSWRMAFDYIDNADDFNNNADGNEEDFNAELRARTWFEFIASENVKAVLGTEIGTSYFGNGALAVGGDAIAIEVKHAYLEFKLPSTPVTIRSGLQYVATPGNLGSLVFSNDASGTLAIVPFNDMVTLTTGWVRSDNALTTDKADEIDIFPVILGINTPMVGAQPYFAYANIGQDVLGVSQSRDNAWWLGVSAQIKPIDNLAILFDAVYGQLNTDEDTVDAKGWGVDLAVDYTIAAPGFTVTPEFFAAYFSGENDDADDGRERMFTRSIDSFALTSFGFTGSSFQNDSYLELAETGPSDALANNGLTPSGIGLWAVGVKAKNLSFVPGLSHNLVLMYARGTNDKDYVEDGIGPDATLTTKDSVLEVNFDTKYKMYDQLAVILELGYLRLNYEDELGTRGDDYVDAPGVKAILGFKYDF